MAEPQQQAPNGTSPSKANPSLNQNYKHLTPSDVDHFLTHGWLRVPGAIEPRYIDRWVRDLWARVGYDEHDRSTWHTEYLHLPRHREVPAEEFAPEAWAKIAEICGGEGRIDPERERWYGDAFIVNFGSEENTKADKVFVPPTQVGWHSDDDWHRLFLDSAGTALTLIHVFTDIPERGGGTCLCEDGIAGTAKYLYDHPEGLDPPVPGDVWAHVKDCEKYTTVTAKKGDVLILHGLLPHVASPNFLHYARVITNPHVTLREPHNLNRPDGNYTLLEQVILRSMGRESVPEFRPTRERMTWYPRNAGFKRAKAEDEVARMVAAARARGLDEASVDSFYQRMGTQEFADFERHNGFHHDVCEAGLLMEQHKIGPAATLS